jgi:hypothetical protein
MAQFSPRVRAARDYILNPDRDPIQGITSLYGRYARTNNFISAVDASARGTFSLSTSILRGTYKASMGVAKVIADVGRAARPIIESTLSTLIGKNDTDDVLNFTDNFISESTQALKEAGRQISLYMGNYARNIQDIERTGTPANLIRSMKTAMLAAMGYDFDINEMIRNSVVIDIETGGLGKNAPIVQLAMADIGRIPDMSNFTPEQVAEFQESISRLTPQEQMERGFLNLQLIPEAILRDDATLTANGNVRTPTYNMTTYLPRSARAFSDAFGGWALNSEGYSVRDFYDEFADEVDPDAPVPINPTDPIARRISDANMQRIQGELEQHGFVTLGDGRRIYSQREAAKLYTIFSHYDYDVALLSSEFYGHSILGINLPISGTAFNYKNQRYVMWETTAPNCKPGVIPNEISNTNNWRISLKSK